MEILGGVAGIEDKVKGNRLCLFVLLWLCSNDAPVGKVESWKDGDFRRNRGIAKMI